MVTTGCLILENFPGASKLLSMNGLLESPHPAIAVSIVLASMALVSIVVSNGSTGVMVLSRCTSSEDGGALARYIIGSVMVGSGPSLETPFHTCNPSGCLFLIHCICASKSS